ncbi:MAG TPA: hypothetical protein VHQ95_08620 [Pyrinomonadaceae bacterium]|nr:hypothetical protein [Pyrinomonadaceae bacterium]
MIGKAVMLSEAIARSDGVPAKIKEMVQNLKIEKVTEEVSRAMDKMNREIASTTEHSRERRWRRKQKTAAERRESMLTRGFIKLGSGAGFMLFLYFLSHAIVLRLDPDIINKVPFDIPSVVRVVWLIGLIPVLSGLGHLFAGLTIKTAPEKQIEFPADGPLRIDPPLPDPALTTASARQPLTSVTERTTNILDRDQPLRKSEAR